MGLSYHDTWGLLKRDLDPEERGSGRLRNSCWLVGAVGVAKLEIQGRVKPLVACWEGRKGWEVKFLLLDCVV